MAWWNLTEVVEWRVSLVCNGKSRMILK